MHNTSIRDNTHTHRDKNTCGNQKVYMQAFFENGLFFSRQSTSLHYVIRKEKGKEKYKQTNTQTTHRNMAPRPMYNQIPPLVRSDNDDPILSPPSWTPTSPLPQQLFHHKKKKTRPLHPFSPNPRSIQRLRKNGRRVVIACDALLFCDCTAYCKA